MRSSGLLEAPEATLDQALEAAPGNRVAHRERGEIRERLGRYEGALEDARAATKATPDDPVARNLLARSQARMAGVAPGVDAEPPAPPRRLRPDAQVDRSSLGAWTREYWPGRMGEMRKSFELQSQRRDWAEAQRTVDAASVQFPGTIFGPFLAGLLDLQRGELDAAEERLAAALRIAPRSPVLVATLGRVWSRKGGAAYAAGRLMTLAEGDSEAVHRSLHRRACVHRGGGSSSSRGRAPAWPGAAARLSNPLPAPHRLRLRAGPDSRGAPGRPRGHRPLPGEDGPPDDGGADPGCGGAAGGRDRHLPDAARASPRPGSGALPAGDAPRLTDATRAPRRISRDLGPARERPAVGPPAARCARMDAAPGRQRRPRAPPARARGGAFRGRAVRLAFTSAASTSARARAIAGARSCGGRSTRLARSPSAWRRCACSAAIPPGPEPARRLVP